MIPTVLIASFVVFFAVRLIPGDIIDLMSEEMGTFTKHDRQAIEKMLGLDVPVFVQFGRWLGVIRQAAGAFNGLCQGNLGESLWGQGDVIKLIAKRWPVTLELGLIGLVMSQIIALPIGIWSVLRQNKFGDYFGRSLATLFISLPNFWVGTMVIVFPSIWWGYMPPIMHVTFSEDPIGNLVMFVVPGFILGMALCGTTMRLTRGMMLEVMRQDYIRTAWSKGLQEKKVVVHHALKNALIPVITLVGLQVPVLVGGTVIIEQIFSLPGMGRLLINAIAQRDYSIVSGMLVVVAVAMVLINLVVDLIYAFLDPRIRYS
jgi:peptide/nickel transport system permease protein